MTQSRLDYVDVVKGLAMLLVVMHHLSTPPNKGIEFITMLDVPIFFLCSGFLAYKPMGNCSDELRKKIKGILVPFLLAVLAAALIRHVNVIHIFTDITKSGYWFLQTLFSFFLFYSPVANLRSNTIKTIYLGGMEVTLLALAKFMPDIINNVFCISSLARFFPCFIVGLILRKSLDSRVLNCKWFGPILIGVTLVGFLGIIKNTNLNFLMMIPAYASGALLVFLFVKEYVCYVPSYLKNLLILIGRYSLNIYIIHFYLVFQAPAWISTHFVPILAYSLVVAIIVALISILIGKVLTSFTPLCKVLR